MNINALPHNRANEYKNSATSAFLKYDKKIDVKEKDIK
jgi:hypothetical protein